MAFGFAIAFSATLRIFIRFTPTTVGTSVTVNSFDGNVVGIMCAITSKRTLRTGERKVIIFRRIIRMHLNPLFTCLVDIKFEVWIHQYKSDKIQNAV
jgi:hypothetical protein